METTESTIWGYCMRQRQTYFFSVLHGRRAQWEGKVTVTGEEREKRRSDPCCGPAEGLQRSSTVSSLKWVWKEFTIRIRHQKNRNRATPHLYSVVPLGCWSLLFLLLLPTKVPQLETPEVVTAGMYFKICLGLVWHFCPLLPYVLLEQASSNRRSCRGNIHLSCASHN